VQREFEKSGDAITEEHQEKMMQHGLNAVWTLGKLEVLLPSPSPLLSFFSFFTSALLRSIAW